MQRLTVGAAALAVCPVAAVLSACTVQRSVPDLAGQDVRLTIIHTADIHSRLLPYSFVPDALDRARGLIDGPFGGIARISTLVKQIRRSTDRSLWLDSGDFLQGAPVFLAFHGEAEVRALTAAGLDGAVLGDHDLDLALDLGAQNLFDPIDGWAGFPLLAANYAWEEPPVTASRGRSLGDVVAPYQIYDLAGVKVGVIGLGNTRMLPSIFEAGNALGVRPITEAAALERWVGVVRPQVDLVVVVSHLGEDQDEGVAAPLVDDPNRALPLAGVDLVLGGHLHIVTDPPVVIPSDDQGHSTLIVHSGAFARFVGQLELVVHIGPRGADPARRSQITGFDVRNLAVDRSVDDDPIIASLMWPYSVKLHQNIDLVSNFVYANTQSAEAKIARNDLSGGDSQLGNLVARAMQRQDGVLAQFALTRSLGIHGDLARGPLAIEPLFNVLPFETTITVMYLSGVEVQDALDVVARRSAERGCRAQAQVAGIAFDLICRGDCPGGQTACAKNVHLGDGCRQDDDPGAAIDPARCAALVPGGLYRVAVDDVLASGGSGFQVLARNASRQDTHVALRDSLRGFLARQAACSPDVIDETDAMRRTVVDRYGAIACLDANLERHDGRIRTVFE